MFSTQKFNFKFTENLEHCLHDFDVKLNTFKLTLFIHLNMEQILSELIIFNEATIKDLNNLLINTQHYFFEFKKTQSSCFEKLTELRAAYCGFPFGVYSEVYYYTLKCPPLGSGFNVEFGSMGPQPNGWIELTRELKEKLDKELPDTESVMNKLVELIGELGSLIKEVIDKNSIIKNLGSLDEEYAELKELNEKWIYQAEEFCYKYQVKDVMTRDIRLIQTGMKYPYHTRIMGIYDALYNSVFLIENKMERSIRILKRINYSLPFVTAIRKGDGVINSTVNIGNFIQGDGNTLANTSSYAISGQMNLNVENKAKIEELLQAFLDNLNKTDRLDKYEKMDLARDADGIITELSKNPEDQDKNHIRFSMGKIWKGVKDIATVSASVISIATALGITL